MPSYRLINLISFRLLDGTTEEGRKSIMDQLRDASNNRHPWLSSPGAVPSRRRAGKTPSGRVAATRSDGPPSDWARKHGWKPEGEAFKSMTSFLSATGNTGTVMQIAKKQRQVKGDG